jgi:hypothetical protein
MHYSTQFLEHEWFFDSHFERGDIFEFEWAEGFATIRDSHG